MNTNIKLILNIQRLYYDMLKIKLKCFLYFFKIIELYYDMMKIKLMCFSLFFKNYWNLYFPKIFIDKE